MAQQDLDTTRDRLLETAGQMFAERGFDATTVRDICNSAGANIAAVNYYFGDKQRLYTAAVVRAHQWRLDQAKLPDWNANTPARQKLADFVRTFFLRIFGGPDDTWRTRLVMREILHPTEACAEIAESNIRPQFEILQSILRELMPADTSDDELHFTAFSIVGQCLFYFVANPIIRSLVDGDEFANYDLDRLADHVTRFSLAAIESRNATSRGDWARAEGDSA